LATQTINLSSADEGRVAWQADYDDVSLLVTAFRCVNNSHLGPTPGKASSRLSLVNDPTKVFPTNGQPRVTGPGVTDSIVVPQAQATRLQLVVQNDRWGRARIANLDGSFEFPVP
jgi:hypothetical protein